MWLIWSEASEVLFEDFLIFLSHKRCQATKKKFVHWSYSKVPKENSKLAATQFMWSRPKKSWTASLLTIGIHIWVALLQSCSTWRFDSATPVQNEQFGEQELHTLLLWLESKRLWVAFQIWTRKRLGPFHFHMDSHNFSVCWSNGPYNML